MHTTNRVLLHRIDLIDNLIVKENLAVGVEVGSFRGEYSREILNRWKGKLYMIDVWAPLEEYDDMSNNKYHPDAYQECINNILEFGERATMIRTFSENAVDLFRNDSLDFVYIDANHSYEYVKRDIEIWYQKVKTGGYLMGHDYLNIDWYADPSFRDDKRKDKNIQFDGKFCGVFGVNPAVDEFCTEMNYVLNVTYETFGTWYIKKS
jgi:hypothetical protein